MTDKPELPNLPPLPSRDELVANYKKSRREFRGGYARWLLLIKQFRVEHDLSILDAERLAISNPHLRRWVERQINSHQDCRKYALRHIRNNGGAALIVRHGDSFNFSIPNPQT
jgi:hypothetical protein